MLSVGWRLVVRIMLVHTESELSRYQIRIFINYSFRSQLLLDASQQVQCVGVGCSHIFNPTLQVNMYPIYKLKQIMFLKYIYNVCEHIPTLALFQLHFLIGWKRSSSSSS